jgi:hypothetical protein
MMQKVKVNNFIVTIEIFSENGEESNYDVIDFEDSTNKINDLECLDLKTKEEIFNKCDSVAYDKAYEAFIDGQVSKSDFLN